MRLPFFIAKRYFFSKKSDKSFNIINIISAISMGGFTVGAMALIIVLSVFNGFENVVLSLFNSFDPDLKIVPVSGKVFEADKKKLALLKNLDGVNYVCEVLEENALLRYEDQQNFATVKGVEKHFKEMTFVDSFVIQGKFMLERGKEDFAVVGVRIAYQLSLNPYNEFNYLNIYVPKKGASVSVLNPQAAFSQKAIFPAGIFAIQEELDAKYVLVPLRFMRELLDQPLAVSALEIAAAKGADVDVMQENVQEILGPEFEVQNRFQQHKLLNKIMRSEKFAAYLILTFILLIAGFNTIGSLYMLVIEKKRDIAILSSMGADKPLVKQIFLLEGMMISIIGGFAGLLIGTFVCWLQMKYGILKLQGQGTFVINSYPVSLELTDITVVFITFVFLGIITSIYPSYIAGKMAEKAIPGDKI